jgi:hypothetical protein
VSLASLILGLPVSPSWVRVDRRNVQVHATTSNLPVKGKPACTGALQRDICSALYMYYNINGRPVGTKDGVSWQLVLNDDDA